MKKVIFLIAGYLFIGCTASAQNVGIGTNAPESKLHVVDVFDVADGSSGAFINLQNATAFAPTGTLAGIRFRLDGVGAGTNARYKGGILFQKTSSFGVGSLVFATNSLANNTSITAADAKMVIKSTGEVGIGEVNPNYKLHVSGGDFFLQSNSGSFRFGYPGGDQWRLATLNGGKDLLWTTSTNGTDNTYRHYFSQNGNVGIGTGSSAPAARLHVSTTSAEVIRMSGASPYLSFYDNTDGYKGYLWYNGTDMEMGAYSAALKFYANGTRMTINSDGRVIIGAVNPATGYKLSVDGKAIFEEARVQLSTSWPDYVFDKKYKLLSLAELEKSIIENKHLPNMPAAAEVEKNGFDLGDMNRRLLEKVEELTLYIIQLKKDNNALEERLNKIETKISIDKN